MCQREYNVWIGAPKGIMILPLVCHAENENELIISEIEIDFRYYLNLSLETRDIISHSSSHIKDIFAL